MCLKRKAFGCKEDWWVIAVIALVILMLIPALTRVFAPRHSYKRARRISCTSNLKQIGLSLKQYAMDYSDFFPPGNNAKGLDILRETDYLTDYGVYSCPNSTTKKGTSGPITDLNCDYIYLGGSKESEAPNTPLAFDKPGNHSNYINVLYLDGHVRGHSIVSPASCENIIIFLNAEHKYPAKLFKKLLSKAKKIDSALPKK